MKAACAALLCCLAAVHSVDIRPCNTYPGSNTLEGFCTEVYATGFGNPRMMAVEVFEGKTLLLVVDSRRSQIVLMVDEDDNGAIEDSEKTVLVDATTTDNVNHGVVIVGDFVFATTGKEMYRWKFDRDARTLTEQVVVIEGFMYYPVEAGGSSDTKWGHQTRTMAVNEDTMFISVGSQKNVDLSPFSSAIRKVALSAVTAATIASPIQFKDMTYLASGLRNEVGLRFDENNTLWGVENGPDNNFRADLGGDVHIDNPPEELNRFDVSQENMFYGYPYCFSEFLLPEEARRIYGHEPRRQWAWERELNQGEPEDAFFVYNDTWCNSDANVIKPHYGFQSHMAPLGISFLKGECGLSESAWPCSLRGKAFVGFHGSWNREPAVGYKVAFIDVETKEVTDVLTSQGEEESWKNVNTRNTRPVDVVFDPVDGKMFVTQDGKGNEGESEILVIRAMNSDFVKETEAPATLAPPPPPTPAPETELPAGHTVVPTAAPTDIRPCNTYPGSNTLEGFCTEVYATGFGNPRMMAVEVFEGKTLLLVVDSRRSQIVLMVDEDGNGAIEDSEKTVLVDATTTDNVNHGVVIVGDFVFATTGKEMYRWKFDRDARTLTEQVVVIEGFMYYPVEAGGSSDTKWGHQTRTMAVNEDTMFISVGSQKNVDLSPFSSAIRKVALSAVTAATIASPIQFKDMTYLASGLRNEVGLRFDENNTLWGVENGPDNNFRADLGGDVHIDNPPEELNRFDVSQENMFYGYPYCFSEFLLPEEARRIYGHEPRRQWAWERELNQGEPEDAFFVYNDTWCNSDANVIKPHYGFQSHMAPLGISFLKGECGLSESAWPCSLRGKAFVGFHGSWNREPAVGYKVAFIDVETKEVTDVLTSQGEEESWKNVNTRNTRPVDVVFDPVDGKMFVTQDGKGNEGESEILVIRAMNSSFVKPPTSEPTPPTTSETAEPIPPMILQHISGVFKSGNCPVFLADTNLRNLLADLLKAVLGVTIEPTYFCGSVHFTASYNATTTATSSAVLDSVNSALDEAVNADLLAVLGKADAVEITAGDGSCAQGYQRVVADGILICERVDSDDDDLSDGAIAAIVVGSVIGAALIVALILLLVKNSGAAKAEKAEEAEMDAHEPSA